MQRKLLNIKGFLVLLTIAYANEENTNMEKRIKGNPLKIAMLKIQSNKEHFKDAFAESRKVSSEIIQNLQNEDEYYLQFERIKNYIQNIVENIEESISILNKIKSIFDNESNPTTEDVINALFLILENTAFFGDIIYKFPKITTSILKIEKRWIDPLTLSLIYTSAMEDFLGASTNNIISTAQERLRDIKEELKLKINKISEHQIRSKFVRFEL
ncbi:PREDICTED: uncharacterized protein LOC106785684 [Polistes canadensis]|uniref:uncharacterized protein LOC106785684 n=1 Tax=Polistes canadensis TaxID=91411 RepID=UPI000718ACA2|nr:PREDICTED: uncharacterized protein LOC106785684 [Polistes canadensis]